MTDLSTPRAVPQAQEALAKKLRAAFPNGRVSMSVDELTGMLSRVVDLVLDENERQRIAALPVAPLGETSVTHLNTQREAPGLPCDWMADFSHENGQYQCRCFKCGVMFYGHKRRVACASCAYSNDSARINYLAEQASKRGPVSSYNVDSPPLVAAIAYDTIHTLREAIDAAMSTTRATAQGEGSE